MSIEWTCPYCNRDTTINDQNRHTENLEIRASNFDATKVIQATYTRCPNKKCHKYTLSVTAGDALYGRQNELIRIMSAQNWYLIPESNAKPFPDYIPEQLRSDYVEACLVKDKSPKASAALSRRCLQGMIRDFFGVKKRNLKAAIEAIKNKIDPAVWKAIDAVRSVGNIGAHMERDVNLIIDVEPQEAELLIDLIERLFKEWYVDRYDRESQMKDLIELAEKKQKERKPKADQDPAKLTEAAPKN